MMEQASLFPDNPEYEAFVGKFIPKKTTDDCYTPDAVYNAVADWVSAEYGLSKTSFVRPFFPGGDYQRFPYPDGCCVVDNPPFSIYSQILNWYQQKQIKFFLFGPALTLFAGNIPGVCYIPVGADVTYDNGAKVKTSFATNLDSEYRVRSAPELYAAIKAAMQKAKKENKKELPKYDYPDCVVTAAGIHNLSIRGVDFRAKASDCVFVRALDAQKEVGKAIFGGGFLLTSNAAAEKAAAEKAAAEKAAAEKAAAEKAAAIRWKLSQREKEIVSQNDSDSRC